LIQRISVRTPGEDNGPMERSPANTRILVVDDDTDIRESTCALLGSFGYETVEAENIALAMQCIVDRPPDVVFTDIHMPEGDGYALLRTLRERNIAVPVIACSGGGYAGGEDPLALALGLGAVAAIEKPFAADQLRRAIAAALAGR
jgi:CheY-like chemotaxis protein